MERLLTAASAALTSSSPRRARRWSSSRSAWLRASIAETGGGERTLHRVAGQIVDGCETRV